VLRTKLHKLTVPLRSCASCVQSSPKSDSARKKEKTSPPKAAKKKSRRVHDVQPLPGIASSATITKRAHVQVLDPAQPAPSAAAAEAQPASPKKVEKTGKVRFQPSVCCCSCASSFLFRFVCSVHPEEREEEEESANRVDEPNKSTSRCFSLKLLPYETCFDVVVSSGPLPRLWTWF